MTPEPSQTPISQESGTSSAGRSTSSSNTASALAAEQVDEHHDRHGADRERREAEQTDEEELERQHHAPSLLRSAAAGAQSPPEVNRVHSQISSVASARIATAPPRLAMMRSTRPSLRARLNWIAKVSSTLAA